MEQRDLETMDDLEAVTPTRDRLRQLLHDTIHRPNYTPQEVEDAIRDLTAAMEYPRDTIVRMWLTGRTTVPLDKLQGISDALFIPLPTLLAAWVARYAPEELSESYWKAARPRITDEEQELIEKARKVYIMPDDDREDERD